MQGLMLKPWAQVVCGCADTKSPFLPLVRGCFSATRVGRPAAIFLPVHSAAARPPPTLYVATDPRGAERGPRPRARAQT